MTETERERLLFVIWLRDLWWMKSQWSPCPDCGQNAFKPENVKHAPGCRFIVALNGGKG